MLIPHSDYPVRPAMQPGESLAGYITRFQGANGHWVPQALQNALCSLYRQREKLPEQAFITIQKVLCSTMPMNRQWEADQPSPSLSVQSHSLPRSLATFNPVQFCTSCLRENGYHLMLWELPQVMTCPVHSIKLLKACTACNRIFRWEDIAPNWSCRCGASIFKMRAPPAAHAEIMISMLLAGATDVATPENLKSVTTILLHGKYQLAEIYDTITWASRVRKELARLPSIWGEKRNKYQTRKATSLIWEVRFLSGSEQTVISALQRVLKRRFRGSRTFVLCLEKHDPLVDAHTLVWHRAEQGDEFARRVRHIVEQYLKYYAVVWPSWPAILLLPCVSVEQRSSLLEAFSMWWFNLASRIGTLDPVQDGRAPSTSKFGTFDAPYVVDVLNVLLSAACHNVATDCFRALTHRWQVPAALQKRLPPEQVLVQLGSYLATLRGSEMMFVHDLVLESRKRTRP